MGQTSRRAYIANISNANQCVVTTTEEHGFETHEFVRLTDLNGARSINPKAPHGSDPLNNYKFKIVVKDSTSFSLQNPITGESINSTDYEPYIEGGNCTIVQTQFTYT